MDVINLVSKARGLTTLADERAAKFYSNGSVFDYSVTVSSLSMSDTQPYSA